MSFFDVGTVQKTDSGNFVTAGGVLKGEIKNAHKRK